VAAADDYDKPHARGVDATARLRPRRRQCAYAAKIISRSSSTGFITSRDGGPVEARAARPHAKLNRDLWRTVDELGALRRFGKTCSHERQHQVHRRARQKTESEMLKTKNFGRKSLKEIKELLAEMGLQLA